MLESAVSRLGCSEPHIKERAVEEEKLPRGEKMRESYHHVIIQYVCMSVYLYTKYVSSLHSMRVIQSHKEGNLWAHLEDKHHASHHGVHVVLAQLLAEGRAHGSQRLQVLL